MGKTWGQGVEGMVSGIWFLQIWVAYLVFSSREVQKSLGVGGGIKVYFGAKKNEIHVVFS